MGYLESMGFDANTVEPDKGREPLPEGEYLCMVEKAEEKNVSNNTGVQLVVELRVLEGPQAKRKIWHRINLQNKSAKCVEIGRAQLSSFCRATGIMTPRAVHEFANRTLRVRVKVAQRSDGKGLTNEVVKVDPAGSAVAGLVQNGTSAPSQPTPAGAGAGAASGAPPWARAG